MGKTKHELLDDYDTRVIKWCLENGTLKDYYDTMDMHWRERRLHRSNQPPPTPWPLTEEEDRDRVAIYKELDEVAEELDDEPQHLMFYSYGNGHKIKIIK